MSNTADYLTDTADYIRNLMTVALWGERYTFKRIARGIDIIDLRNPEAPSRADRVEVRVTSGKIARNYSAPDLASLAILLECELHKSTLKRLMRTTLDKFIKANF